MIEQNYSNVLFVKLDIEARNIYRNILLMNMIKSHHIGAIYARIRSEMPHY